MGGSGGDGAGAVGGGIVAGPGPAGPVPLRLLFEAVAGPLAAADTPGGFWRGRRVLSVDGTTLDVQDTAANWARFGGPGTADEAGRALRGGFPKLRVVALAECGTRALIGARQGSYATSEKALTIELLGMLGEGMLVLADRNFSGYDLWRQASATGADLLWRAGSGFALPVATVLADGTYLSTLSPPKPLRRTGAARSPCGWWSTTCWRPAEARRRRSPC